MNKLKKILLMLMVAVPMLFNVSTVSAASSISFSTGSPKVGKKLTVTVTVSNVNTVDLTATVSGAGVNSTIRLVDGSMSGDKRNFSKGTTVTPTQEGTITVKIADSSNAVRDGKYVDVGGDKSVSVSKAIISTPTTPSGGSENSSGGTTQTPVEDNRSKENSLSSLTVSQGSLDPQFSENKTKYNIDLSGTAKEVIISAKAKDSKAKVSGTGKKSLKVGENTFNVVCTAENGSKKTYTLVFHVDEAPLVYTKLGEKNLGVVRILNDVKAPTGFKIASAKLEGQDIDAYTNEQLNMTLAYLVDEGGNKDFYIIENEKVVSQFRKITAGSREYIVVNAPKDLEGVSGLKQSKVKISDLELDGWSYDDEALQNYSIVYLMNSDGKAQLYSYEATEGTLQIYTPATESNSLNTLTYVFIGTTVVAGVVAIAGFVMYFNFKKKSISAIKDYYKKKNQG